MKLQLYLLGVVATLSLVGSAPVILDQGRSPSPQCDPGEEDDCAKCYDALVNELIINDRNRYNLQKAFFPPDVENPVFVTVTYIFARNRTGDGSTNYTETGPSETWIWTLSSTYLFQPLESIQFTSLLFSDPSLRENNVTLYLKPLCQNSSKDYRLLLTQRVSMNILDSLHACMVYIATVTVAT